MSSINYEFIEKYQKVLQEDPKSQVFAPLGEAYRKMGLLKEAHETLKRGVRFHPHFASGRVAFAKVLIEQKDYEEAIEQLKNATQLSPENLLAHRLLAECHIYKKKPKEALKAFKMVLFLNPNDAQAMAHVKKLESLTADEYEDDVFEMRPLKEDIAPQRAKKLEFPSSSPSVPKDRQVERLLSLADAFIARLDLDRALETLEHAENQAGAHPEISKRKNFLKSRLDGEETGLTPKNSSNSSQRIDILRGLLQKIESRRYHT